MKRIYVIVLIALALFVVAAFAQQSSTPAAPASCPMMAKHEKVAKMAADLTASFERVRAAKDEAARKSASDEHARLLADFQQTVSEPMACARKQGTEAGGCDQGGCCSKMKAEGAAAGCMQGGGCCKGHGEHSGGCCAGMAQGQ